MEDLKAMKKTLMTAACAQMGDLANTDTHELGEVIDMIKDLEEACYYHTIVEAMEETDEYGHKYFKEIPYYPNPKYDRDRYEEDRPYKMYYHGSRDGITWKNPDSSYQETKIPTIKRDPREGRSGLSRKGYMEAKEGHLDKDSKMRELEKYMSDITQDIAELLNDLSQEERDMIRNKMAGLVNRI